MSETILYVKVYNTIDPFGKRLVEKVSVSATGQKFIKQYHLSQVEFSNFMEQCRMSNIRVEMSSSLGDDAFLSNNANFTPSRPSASSTPYHDPSMAFRSSMNSPPAVVPTVALPPPSMQNSSSSHENFVDFNDTSNFGACMFGGGGNLKYNSR